MHKSSTSKRAFLFRQLVLPKAAVAAIVFCILVPTSAPAGDDDWIPLFNGKDLNGWYTFLLTTGKNHDPKKFFKVEHGMIHVLDISGASEWREVLGYLATEREYSNVRVHIEYKWGTKRFSRSLEGKRNSGLLYFLVGPDKVFPRTLECQIQETDTGDLWITDGLAVTTWVVDPNSSFYSDDAGGPATKRTMGGPQVPSSRIIKSGDFEERSGWNVVEVVMEGDSATQIVNGRTVNRAWDIRQPDPHDPTHMAPVTKGRIALEAEGSEIWFRNVKIKLLKQLGHYGQY